MSRNSLPLVLAAGLGAGIGGTGVGMYAASQTDPSRARIVDLNQDDYLDVEVRRGDGAKVYFMGGPNEPSAYRVTRTNELPDWRFTGPPETQPPGWPREARIPQAEYTMVGVRLDAAPPAPLADSFALRRIDDLTPRELVDLQNRSKTLLILRK